MDFDKIVLSMKELSFAYPGVDKDCLHSVSMSLRKGEIYGFLGPSGAGKSTCQKLLLGLLPFERGEVKLFGHDLSGSSRAIFNRIGVCFETPNLYSSLSALENLQLFASLFTKDVRDPEELLDELGLHDVKNKRVSKLSKGMKTRVNFCRSLLPQPDLLFLDEPTGGLDPGNAVLVRSLIKRERERGAAVFLTTHNMDLASKLCDRLAFLLDGSIVAEGRADDLGCEEEGAVIELVSEEAGETRRSRFPLEGLAENAAFYRAMKRGKIKELQTVKPSLEELFLRYTKRNDCHG